MKLALWGTPRDARTLDRIQQLYPLSLARFCEKRGWGQRMPRQGAELRHRNDKEEKIQSNELKGQKRFDADKFNKLVKGGLYFSLPKKALTDIPDSECYVRKRGGLSGLAINKPPHLLIPMYLALKLDVPARRTEPVAEESAVTCFLTRRMMSLRS